MQRRILKYILDIEHVILEIELIKQFVENDFVNFNSSTIAQRALERNLEIIGEAVRNLILIDPNISITSTNKIIGLRNIIAHAYDSIEPELIWAIAQRDIPILSDEIQQLKNR